MEQKLDNFISSPNLLMLNPELNSVKNQVPKTKDEIIENINYLFKLIGLFSSKVIGKDQFDGIIYNEHDKSLLCEQILSSNTISIYSPYNSIVFHSKNKWKMNCLNLKFNISNNIIYDHNFPKIFNIKRSDGSIQKALIKDNDGLIIRKENIIYLRANYNSNPNADISDITILLDLYKDIPIQEILELNEIKELTFNFYNFTADEISNSNVIEAEVKTYYNNLQNIWITKKIKPITDSLKNIIEIKYNFKNFS
jgi:hypothetical protein